MRKTEEFIAGLNDGREVYYRGKRVESISEHPVLKVAAHHAAKLFKIERSAYDNSLGGEVSAYFVTPRSTEDLVMRHKLVYNTTMACNGIFNISQAIGSDAIFALAIVARETDRKYGTQYASCVEAYHREVAEKDLTLAVAQTDAKGDRKKRPHEQEDPDVYVHLARVEEGGIVVSGAKAHTTQAAVVDEIVVIPTRAMVQQDRDFALAFAVPAATKGLKFIVRPIEELEGNSSAIVSRQDYELETLTIFDEVFVPWNRVFQFRQHDMAGPLAVTFATFHRFTAVSYRSATSNLFIGAALEMAKQNGILDSSHVRDRLTEMVMYKELMRMSALAGAELPVVKEQVAVPNPVYTNIGKLYSNKYFSNLLDALIDVSGGIISTVPSLEDMQDDYEGKYITKYLAGAKDGEARKNAIRLAKELAASSYAGYMHTLMLHAEGSIEASKMALLKDADLSDAERLVRDLLSKSGEEKGEDVS